VRRSTVLVIAAVLGVVAAVAVVALVVWPSSSGSVDDALDVVPADADLVTFTDVAAARDRLGYGDLTSESSESEQEDYISEAIDGAPWAYTSLDSSWWQMEDWDWGHTDIEWEIAYQNDDANASAFKLRDDLDMDLVTGTFGELGYESSEIGGNPAYSLDVEDVPSDEEPVVPLLNVVVLPEDHLLLTGPDAESLLDPATGDAESLADAEPVADVTDALGDPEFAHLAMGETSCIDALDGAEEEPPGYSDFHEITAHGTAVTVVDDQPVGRAAAGYADAEAATADVDPRAAFIEDGTAPTTDEPYSELFTAGVESDGSVVRYELDGDDVAQIVLPMVQRQELPWAYCAPDQES
jgi:hypothetical protein